MCVYIVEDENWNKIGNLLPTKRDKRQTKCRNREYKIIKLNERTSDASRRKKKKERKK